MKLVPSYVFNGRLVNLIDVLRSNRREELSSALDIPKANPLVVRPRDNKPGNLRVPAETVPFLIVPSESELRLAHVFVFWSCWVLLVIEDQNISAYCLGGDYVVLLRHVPYSV